MRKAVITGSTKGIGFAFARELLRRGHSVAVTGRARTTVDEAVARLRPQAAGDAVVHGHALDVADAAQVEELWTAAADALGGVDLWINNAGVFPEAPATDIPVSQIQATLSINVEGVLYGAQAAASVMAEGGAIVNMASVAAVRVRRGRAAYCSSKAAVAHLTECLAVEFGDLGIRVNAIAPGFVDTEMTRWVQDDPPALAKALDSIPLHRLGSPEEIVGPMLFLLSDSARYVTGHILAVDGGSRHV